MPNPLQQWCSALAAHARKMLLLCVRVADIRGPGAVPPPRWLSPWRWLQKQGRKYVSAARHTRIVERFLYGWLEYERIHRGWITQAQQVILDNFNLASRVPEASSSLRKIHFVMEGGGDLANKTLVTGTPKISFRLKIGRKKKNGGITL